MADIDEDLLRQIMPISTYRALSCCDKIPFSSDLDYYQLLEAKILLQVVQSKVAGSTSESKLVLQSSGQEDADAQ